MQLTQTAYGCLRGCPWVRFKGPGPYGFSHRMLIPLPDLLPQPSLVAYGSMKPMAFIFLVLFVLLFVVWFFSFVVFHIASGLIHILLVLAIISIIVHFVRRPSK